MPKYKPTAQLKKILAEPIEFELAGQEFKIEKVTSSMLQKVMKLAPKDADTFDMSAIVNMLRSVLSEIGRGEDFDSLGELDMREVNPLMKWLSEQLNGGLEEDEKNLAGVSPESPQNSPDSSDTPTC